MCNLQFLLFSYGFKTIIDFLQMLFSHVYSFLCSPFRNNRWKFHCN